MTDDFIKGSRESTLRQYQSAWRAFQLFLAARPVTTVSLPVVWDFLSHVFHAKRRCAATVATYAAALADPLQFAFGIDVRGRVWDMMKRAFYNQRPPRRRPGVFWCLQKVLDLLQGPDFSTAPGPHQLLRKALFLVAMASGLRASQLHALVRSSTWLVFAEDGRQVSLAPSPRFLAKNERVGHTLRPLVLQAWMEGPRHHALCPVQALRSYVAATPGRGRVRLFIWPDSGRPLTRLHISKLLCGVIEEADPGKAPRGHDVRAMSSTLAFLRHHSLDRVMEQGQWSSDHSFVSRYLLHSLGSVPCSTMAGPPSPQPASSSLD